MLASQALLTARSVSQASHLANSRQRQQPRLRAAACTGSRGLKGVLPWAPTSTFSLNRCQPSPMCQQRFLQSHQRLSIAVALTQSAGLN